MTKTNNKLWTIAWGGGFLFQGKQSFTIGSCKLRLSHHSQAQGTHISVALDVSLSLLLSSFLIISKCSPAVYMMESGLQLPIKSITYDSSWTYRRAIPLDMETCQENYAFGFAKTFPTHGQKAQILWGLYHQEKVDYVYLLWEDLVFQIENKEFIPQHEVVQRYGAILQDYLTNPTMKESEAYKTYHDLATGKVQPKLKFYTAIFQQLALGLETLSDIALTEAAQMKLAIKRSKTQFHISQPSYFGTHEGTGVTPGVPDVPTYESDDEQISWKSSKEEEDDKENVNEHEDDDDGERTESDNDGDDFVHPKFSTHDDEAKQVRNARDDEDKNEEPSVGIKPECPREDELEKNQRQPVLQRKRHPRQLASQLMEPAHQEFDIGATEEQSDEETSQHPDWFQKPAKIPTLDHDWNKTLPAVHKPVQPWLSNLAREEGPRESFDELMDTPLDFSAFMMNRLKIDTLTPELLAGPTFKLMKVTCKSLVELEYFFEEVYKATTDQLDGISLEDANVKKFYGFEANRESARDVLYNMDSLLSQCFKFGRMAAANKPFGLDQQLTNLSMLTIVRFWCLYWIIYKSIVIQRRVEDLQLEPMMRIDELHKFSDGTLDDVRTALNDRLKGIRMKYLPKTIWRQSDRERAKAMIQAIDKQLKSRRI
ncbi:hypothetical protein Tco_0739871 [Tanacetum coccineum]